MSEPQDTTRAVIARLSVSGAAARDPRVLTLPRAAIVAALLALAPVIFVLGVRADLLSVLGDVGGQKALAGAALAVGAALYCRDAARPDARTWLAVLLLPGLISFVGPALLSDTPLPRGAAVLSDPAGPVCFATILMLALAPLGVLIAGLRNTAPARPFAAGLAAGALAAGLASCAYALHCTADSESVVAFWYPASVATAALFGALIGSRWLRW
jgi:hypothetical protein